MNKLTNVPTNIAPIIAMESGFCNSDPMSNENSNGTMANMVVSDVMIIGNKRSRPASAIASINFMPSFRCRLMVSTFRMESLMTIPAITMIPVMDIKSMDKPNR